MIIYNINIIYIQYIISSIFTLLFRAFKISSTYSLFHSEVLIIESYFFAKQLSLKTIQCCCWKVSRFALSGWCYYVHCYEAKVVS